MRVFVTEKFLFIKEQLYAQFFGAVKNIFFERFGGPDAQLR